MINLSCFDNCTPTSHYPKQNKEPFHHPRKLLCTPLQWIHPSRLVRELLSGFHHGFVLRILRRHTNGIQLSVISCVQLLSFNILFWSWLAITATQCLAQGRSQPLGSGLGKPVSSSYSSGTRDTGDLGHLQEKHLESVSNSWENSWERIEKKIRVKKMVTRY